LDYGAIVQEADGAIRLTSGASPRMLTGLDLLIQTVVIEICSDISDRGGSGFIRALFENPLDEAESRSIISNRLRLAEENILTSQRDSQLSGDERLQELELTDLRSVNQGWEADLALTSVSGITIVRSFSGAQ
jgi:hypothetical protein